VTSYPAPELCQGADEDLLITIGDIIFPGFVKRREGENGLRLWVDGTANDGASRTTAADRFQTLLGVLRAWRSVAGQLREEQRAGLGSGAARDPLGNQWITLGTAITYTIFGGEDRTFAEHAAGAINTSQSLGNALWLNGRPNRNAADFYMIHEYAKHDLGGAEGIRAALGITRNQQERLTQSANNLSPMEGGRHIGEHKKAPWTLEQQQEFAADLLRRWIMHLA
jgi:hypothetical protein